MRGDQNILLNVTEIDIVCLTNTPVQISGNFMNKLLVYLLV